MPRIGSKGLFDGLVKNALDFLERAATETKDSPKYAAIHFCTGLELFLKARLMREHWSLIISKVEAANIERFAKGDFHSVSMEASLDRLKNICGETFSKQELEAYSIIRNRRNRVVHFFDMSLGTEATAGEVSESVAEQCKAWFYLDRRLRRGWRKYFRRHALKINKLGKDIHRNREFLAAKSEEVKPEIEAARREGKSLSNV